MFEGLHHGLCCRVSAGGVLVYDLIHHLPIYQHLVHHVLEPLQVVRHYLDVWLVGVR